MYKQHEFKNSFSFEYLKSKYLFFGTTKVFTTINLQYHLEENLQVLFILLRSINLCNYLTIEPVFIALLLNTDKELILIHRKERTD